MTAPRTPTSSSGRAPLAPLALGVVLGALVLAGCSAGGGLRVETADGGLVYDTVEYVVLRGGALSPPRDSVRVTVYGTVRCSESARLYPLAEAAVGWASGPLRPADAHGDVVVPRAPDGADLLVSPTDRERDAVRLPAARLRDANAVVVAFSGALAMCDVTAARASRTVARP